jgi:hypothetical protein
MVKLIDPDFTALTATGQSPPEHTVAKKQAGLIFTLPFKGQTCIFELS